MSVIALSEAVAAKATASETNMRAPAALARVLHVEDLYKSFGKKLSILKGVSLSLAANEAVALIGSNGAGKSTLLRCCVRLVEPDSGRIELLEQDARAQRGVHLRRLRAQVGFVFQRHNLVPRLSVLTNVIHGAQARTSGPRVWYQSLAPSALRREALHCLDQVGLAGLADRRADQLSGGQSQRVAIARVLMQRPRLVFADEPVASLDPRAGQEVMELFTETMRRERLSVLFTTHDVGDAINYSDRVIGLQGGRVTLNGISHQQDAAELHAIYDDAKVSGAKAS